MHSLEGQSDLKLITGSKALRQGCEFDGSNKLVGVEVFLVDLFDSSQLIELARDRIEGVIALGGGVREEGFEKPGLAAVNIDDRNQLSSDED